MRFILSFMEHNRLSTFLEIRARERDSCITSGMQTDARRFLMLSSAIGVAVCIASTYCFSIFSNSLKVDYGFGQDDITTISTVATACGMFSMPGGFLFDFAGPKLVLFLATLFMGTGYILWALAFANVIPGSLGLFCTANGLVLLGSGWMDVGSLMTCILNFPKHRGAVVALQKTFMGLGSTIIATCFVAFFSSSLTQFAIFLAIVVFSFGMLGVAMIDLPPYYVTTIQARKLSQEAVEALRASLIAFQAIPASQRRFRYGFVLLTMNMVFLTSYNIVVAYVDLSDAAKVACASCCIVLFLSFCALCVIPSEVRVTTDEEGIIGTPLSLPELPINKSGHQNAPLIARDRNYADATMIPQFESTFVENLRHPLLWCLCWTSFCNIGTGVVIVVNSAQIYRAVNDNVFVVSTNALIVALMGVASALSRIIIGSTDLILEKKRREQQVAGKGILSVPLLTVTYPVSSVVAVTGASLLLVLPADALLLPMVLLSMAYGFIWASTALCVRLMFARDVGKHYNFCFLGAVASTVGINRFCFGELFDIEARSQGTYPFCSGTPCIRTSMLILIGLNASAILTSLYVHVTFKRHCQSKLQLPAMEQ